MFKVIIVGDWNIIFYLIDKYGGCLWFGMNYRNFFFYFMDELGFVDVYWVLYFK